MTRTEVIRNAVEKVTGVPASELGAASRKHEAATARFLAAHQLRRSGMSLQAIGNMMRRDHTSIIYMLKKYDENMRFDPDFRRKAAMLEAMLKDEK